MAIRLQLFVVGVWLAVASAYRPGIDGVLQRPADNFTGTVPAVRRCVEHKHADAQDHVRRCWVS